MRTIGPARRDSANLRGPRRRSFDGDLDQGKTNTAATIKLGGAPNTIRFRRQFR
jgi:hypothetical protein